MGIRNRLLCAALLGMALAAGTAGAADAPVSRAPIASQSPALNSAVAACGSEVIYPGTEEVDKFCTDWVPDCGACVLDSGCTITDNRDKPVGGTNRRTVDMRRRTCSYDCRFPIGDGQICQSLFQEYKDFGDCSRCQPF